MSGLSSMADQRRPAGGCDVRTRAFGQDPGCSGRTMKEAVAVGGAAFALPISQRPRSLVLRPDLLHAYRPLACPTLPLRAAAVGGLPASSRAR